MSSFASHQGGIGQIADNFSGSPRAITFYPLKTMTDMCDLISLIFAKFVLQEALDFPCLISYRLQKIKRKIKAIYHY